jgi:RHS repeat-associated protein
VLGIVDEDGLLKERYEYTPYGQRTVFISAGSYDLGCHAPTYLSQRVQIDGWTKSYGLCEFGHQGLMHDEESDGIDNRTRVLLPRVGRHAQPDHVGQYVDGMNGYEYVGSNPLSWTDPTGLWKKADHIDLTRKSFDEGIGSEQRPIPYDLEVIKKILVKANLSQDSVGSPEFNDLKRHYTRAIDKTNQNVPAANTAYTGYIESEFKEYRKWIAADKPTKDDCKISLKALGRLTHTWQDYYGHAVLMNGQAGPAWSADPQITGSPDNLNPQLKPCSWGSLRNWGEHGGSEPAERDGSMGGAARWVDAKTYVVFRLLDLYPGWEAKCACYFQNGGDE